MIKNNSLKYILLSFTFLFVSESFSFSIKRYSLQYMIEASNYIVKGKIIYIEDVDSIRRKQLRTKSMDMFPNSIGCGYCSKQASFVVSKVLKGEMLVDTIRINYGVNPIFLLKDFHENEEYILFLDKFEEIDSYYTTKPRSGSKSMHLDEYERLVDAYLSLKSKKDKRNWIIDLCINPKLSYEGTLSLEYSTASDFSKEEQEKLRKGLESFSIDTYGYNELAEIVAEFP